MMSLLLAAVVTFHSVILTWHNGDVYKANRVYRSETAGGPYSLLIELNPPVELYKDTTALGGHTYYYVVTGVGTNDVESTYSNEVQAKMPRHYQMGRTD